LKGGRQKIRLENGGEILGEQENLIRDEGLCVHGDCAW
jgi:hypothetical protein